jgi:DNA-binding response OmpR family regulator
LRAAKRIVVVDDDREIATAVRDLLVPAGFVVDTPSEPRSALVETIREAPDLVILDVNMPGMTGWEFCAILRRQTATRETPVLFLTGRSEVKDRITAMQLGGSDFLAKPFGAEELRRKVRSLLDEPEPEPDTMEAG